jgi:hypothetical protein
MIASKTFKKGAPPTRNDKSHKYARIALLAGRRRKRSVRQPTPFKDIPANVHAQTNAGFA